MEELNRSDIKDLRGDLSPFLIHLTRNGWYKLWADIYNLQSDDNEKLDAKDSLSRIINESQIEARCPFGYFNFRVNQGYRPEFKVQRHWLRSVCFTETPVDHIYVQFQKIRGRQYEFQKYGLAFFEKSICSRNGHPVMYFNTKDNDMQKALDVIAVSDNCEKMKHLLPFYEGFGPPIWRNPHSEIDFRWEREWRIAGNFRYRLDKDVAFGICPIDEIANFEKLAENKFPFIDPSKNSLRDMKEKLKSNKKLKELIK